MGLNQQEPFSKRPRLKDFDYIGTHAYFITIRTKERTAHFREAEVVSRLAFFLLETAKSEGFDVLAYCFMPDHLHLLVMGTDEKSNFKRFTSLFKQKSGYWFKQNYNDNLWHISYYDHVLRKEESLEGVARYILENPVRKGFVSDYRDYPFTWSSWTDQS